MDLPDTIADFQYLRVMRLKYNQLRKLPGVLIHLQQLKVLELSGNQITKLDDFVAHLPQLKDLDLSGNLLKEVPDSLCQMPAIQVIQNIPQSRQCGNMLVSVRQDQPCGYLHVDCVFYILLRHSTISCRVFYLPVQFR